MSLVSLIPANISACPLWCSPRASQAAAVSSESPETQEEREKAWMRGGRQPEILSSGFFGFKILSPLHLLFGLLTMVGELAAPLPGTARGLTVRPCQDRLLKMQKMMFEVTKPV